MLSFLGLQLMQPGPQQLPAWLQEHSWLQEHIWLLGSVELQHSSWKLIACLKRGAELSWHSTEQEQSWAQAETSLESRLWCQHAPSCLAVGQREQQRWFWCHGQQVSDKQQPLHHQQASPSL